jgi:hypothetical protein
MKQRNLLQAIEKNKKKNMKKQENDHKTSREQRALSGNFRA